MYLPNIEENLVQWKYLHFSWCEIRCFYQAQGLLSSWNHYYIKMWNFSNSHENIHSPGKVISLAPRQPEFRYLSVFISGTYL